MGQAFTMLFPDSANNWWSATQNVFYNNLQSGVPTQSPGGSTGQKTVLSVRLYIQTIILPRQARDKQTQLARDMSAQEQQLSTVIGSHGPPADLDVW